MFLDFNNWEEYNGFSPGGGASEKEWIINNITKEIGLFKFPKTDNTYEHFSEKLASELANKIGLNSAKIDIGIYENRIGSISYLINDPKYEELREGIWLIYKNRPFYKRENLQDIESGDYYCLEMILEALNGYNLNKSFFEIMIFDYIIGNTDRHESNWAVLLSQQGVRLCPIYDNGSSLCCYLSDEKIMKNKNNTQWIKSVIDTKSRSRIRIDKKNSK